MDLTDLIEVIDSRGRTLTPCKRKVADREVRLGRAKWIGRSRIRLRFDPFAYRYIRLKVLARDKYTCYWCGQPGFTMDHVTPWSKGGRTTMTNCICACEECNGQRGDMPAEEFARRMNRPVPLPGVIQSGRHLTAGAAALAEDPAAEAQVAAAEEEPRVPGRLAALLDPHLRPVSRGSLF
ncbi:MAG: HNH endonuclease [Bacillota bacterium]